MKQNEDKPLVGCVLIAFFVGLLLFLGWSWYKAGVQQRVYQRQGTEMTQWEVFLGAIPVERSFTHPTNKE